MPLMYWAVWQWNVESSTGQSTNTVRLGTLNENGKRFEWMLPRMQARWQGWLSVQNLRADWIWTWHSCEGSNIAIGQLLSIAKAAGAVLTSSLVVWGVHVSNLEVTGPCFEVRSCFVPFGLPRDVAAMKMNLALRLGTSCWFEAMSLIQQQRTHPLGWSENLCCL